VDECAWYAIAFLVDTTFGLVLSVIFLKVLIWLAHKFDWPRLKDSGIYFVDETDRSETGCLCLPFLHKLHCIRNCWFKKTWRCQFYAWLLILTLVKVILALFMYMFSASLAIIGGWMFSPFQVRNYCDKRVTVRENFDLTNALFSSLTLPPHIGFAQDRARLCYDSVPWVFECALFLDH